MLNVTYMLSFLIIKTSYDTGIIMNHEKLSKLIKIMHFMIKVPLSCFLVQFFLYKHITLKLNLLNQHFSRSPVISRKSRRV